MKETYPGRAEASPKGRAGASPKGRARKVRPHPTLRYESRAYRNGARCIAGVDEAGRGPLAGPVIACALMLNTTKFKNRIDDSKILTDKQRQYAAREIRDKSIFSLGVKDHIAIDSINILQATIEAIKIAIRGLSKRPDIILVDGNMKLGI